MKRQGEEPRGERPRRGLTDLTHERDLLAAGVKSVVGMDEVGRGCIAGPVGVGAVWFDLATLVSAPLIPGLRDSKKLAPSPRALAADAVRATWVHHAVGYASPGEIDELGLSAALRLAGRRALAELPACDVVMLDGSFNWLGEEGKPQVRTYVKGDDTYIPIAAASVIAKVDRDTLMERLDAEHPGYGWATNKGYPSPAHKEAVRVSGVTKWHRRSFRLGV